MPDSAVAAASRCLVFCEDERALYCTGAATLQGKLVGRFHSIMDFNRLSDNSSSQSVANLMLCHHAFIDAQDTNGYVVLED